MKLPARFIRGQTLTADRLNDLIEAIRRARPLPGAGVSTRESPDGTFISAAAQKQSPATPFDHRFKVSFAKNKDGGYDLEIRKGSLWRVADGVATEQPLTLGEALAQHPTDTDAWQVADAAKGSLYVSQSTADDGETPVYTLDYAAEPTAPAAVIADFTPSQSSSNPTPNLTQRHLGDLILFADTGAPAATDPAAWMIRRHAFTETNTSGETVTTHKWQVFSPLWCAGRQTLLPEGMARGWNDLPEDADSGTLYAALTWVGTATADADGSETVSWAPGNPILTNSLADIPPDDDPIAEDTGSSSSGSTEAKTGHRSVVVPIGEFAADSDTGNVAFTQFHIGAIIENVRNERSATLPAFTFVSEIAMENGSLVASRTRWDGSAFVDAGTQTISPSATQSFEFKRLAWQGNVLRQGTTTVTITALIGSVSVTDHGLYDSLFGVSEHPANEATPYEDDTTGAVPNSAEISIPEDNAKDKA